MKDVLSGFLFGVSLVCGLGYFLLPHTPISALIVSDWLLWSQRSES
jgi:hypothetical protein